MNKNVKIAKELIKLAKNLVAFDEDDFDYYDSDWRHDPNALRGLADGDEKLDFYSDDYDYDDELDFQCEMSRYWGEECTPMQLGKNFSNFTGRLFIKNFSYVEACWSAKVKNATFKFKDDAIQWKKGTWIEGQFYGTWHNGVFEKGSFYSGSTWENGTWESGTWNGGIWENGTWKGGTWYGGTWKGGYDKKGKYHGEGDSPNKWNK